MSWIVYEQLVRLAHCVFARGDVPLEEACVRAKPEQEMSYGGSIKRISLGFFVFREDQLGSV